MKRILFTLAFLFLWTGVGWGYTETFYLSANGDGSAPETIAGAWDLSDLDTAGNWDSDDEDDGKLGPNDQVIFLDDDGVIRGIFEIHESGLSGKPITLSAESGGSPKLYGSQEYDSGAQWSSGPGADEYQTDADSFANDVGMIYYNTNTDTIGFASKVENYGDLDVDWEFWHDTDDPDDKIIVYHEGGSPDTQADGIEVCYGGSLITIGGKSYITIQDLTLKYGNHHGVWLNGETTECTYITVDGCTLYGIGGKYQGGTTRLGNGLELWCDGHHITFTNNTLEQIYDGAISVENGAGCTGNSQTYITVSHNTISYFAVAGFNHTMHAANGVYNNFYIHNNHITQGGAGFGGDDRDPDCAVNGIRFRRSGASVTCTDIYVYENYIADFTGDTSLDCDGTGICLRGAPTSSQFSRNWITNMSQYGVYAAEDGTSVNRNPTADFLYNVIWENSSRGIRLLTAEGGTIGLYGNLLYNNTGTQVYSTNFEGTINVKNNIFYGYPGSVAVRYGPAYPTLDSDYNCYYQATPSDNILRWDAEAGAYDMTELGDWTTARGGDDTNSNAANPLLTDATNDIFSLASGSPCLEDGTALGTAYDVGFDLADSSVPDAVITRSQYNYGDWEMGPDIQGTVTASGTVTPTHSTAGVIIKSVAIALTSTSTGIANGTIEEVDGSISQVLVVPDGADTPTTRYDVQIMDDSEVDILGGGGLNMDSSISTSMTFTTLAVSGDLDIYGYDFGDTKKATVYIYWR